MADILMPKATAVWLVENTSLTFEQIADFCGLHPLEVSGIADGEVARDIRGADPMGNGQLTREELDKAQANDAYRMKAQVSRHAELLKPQKKAPRYTPVSRRQDRPDAIAWFLRHHPEVTDAQISKLLGTTKSTIEQVRARTHWNAANIKPVDPVTLGLVGQLELDALVKKAAEKKAKDDAEEGHPAGRPDPASGVGNQRPAGRPRGRRGRDPQGPHRAQGRGRVRQVDLRPGRGRRRRGLTGLASPQATTKRPAPSERSGPFCFRPPRSVTAVSRRGDLGGASEVAPARPSISSLSLSFCRFNS